MLNIPEEVKIALRQGNRRKNYKMLVNDVNPETNARTYLYTIDNDSIVKESVKIDERMATGKNLKFGLCEGSSLEFQYFDHPNINGKDIQVFISIEYIDSDGDVAWYDIPMGWYTVDQCPVQWDTGIYKVTAYNKLKSKYLDQKANALIEEEFSFENQVYVTDIINLLLKDYAIDKKYETQESTYQGTTGATSDAANTFSPYRYTTIKGDQGPIGPAVLDVAGVTTSTDIYIDATAAVNYYNLQGNDKSIRIEIPNYFDEIDKRIADFYQENLNKISANASGATLWNRLKNMKGRSGWIPNEYLTNYFFNITIEFNDNSKQTYGLNAKNSNGSFEELAKITLLNVKKVYVVCPAGISFGRSLDPDTGTQTELAYGIMNSRNTVLNWGEDKYYCYEDNSGNFLYDIYQTPKMLDGSDIPNPSDLKNSVKVYKIIGGESDMDYITVQPTSLPEVTLRELQTAVYETNCQFGQINRETDLFSGVELNQGGLYPADTLYPDNALYPQGNMLHPFPSSYSKLWTDTVGEQSFRYLIITYKAIENGQEVEKTLQRTVNTYGTTNYNMSDNWLFRNLIWTAEDVGDYADAMVLKMKDIRWFPFEMWAAGLPHIETGDAIEITDKNGDTHTSYVLTRTLNGIQDLQDTFINGELDVF